MLKQRLLTALVLIPLVVWGVMALPTAWLALILALFVLLGFWEWSRLAQMGSPAVRGLYLLVAVMLLGLVWMYGRGAPITMPLLYVALAWWVAALFWVLVPTLLSTHSPLTILVKAIAGFIVLVPAWLALVSMHADPELGPRYLLFVLVLTWVADSGAYFAGRKWGRNKLAPRVSPGKTREGVYGGMVLVAVYAAVVSWQWDMHGSAQLMFVLLCMFIAMVSVLGDLFESLLKRHAGIKDSGAIFPGHGGVLDRIDSLTAVAPLFLLGLHWLGVAT